MGKRRKAASPPCPDPAHVGSSIIGHGQRTGKSGVRKRYLCTPLVGAAHVFSLLVTPSGVPVPTWSPPPACPDHPSGYVVRDGRYASSTRRPRQRYRCYPTPGGTEWHRFTPALPRDHVHADGDSCAECDELRGLHRGDQAVARRQSWSARLVAETLRDLSRGMTYAEASLRVRNVTGRTVTRSVEGEPKRRAYTGSRLARNAWHVAADWTETFSPVLWDHLDARLRAETAGRLARRDELLAAGLSDPEPMVVVIDDVPIYATGTDADGAYLGRRDYFVLVVGEVLWGPGPRATLDRRIRLRLVRAYPSSDHYAWKLLFAELGYTPDVILADAGKGIIKAVEDVYGGASLFVPSLFHVRRAVEKGLYDTPGAWTRASKRAPKELRPELSAHVGQLTRKHLTTMGVAEWSAWWNDLEALLGSLGVPVEKTRRRRVGYEARVAKALPTLTALPQLPVSTGGLEVAIRKRIEPIFTDRARSFANIERTNRLLDLVVCNDHGLFDDVTVPARLLRDDSSANDGWSTALRQVADRQPPKTPTGVQRYSSLRDQHLVRSIARSRGLA
jgi:hypothetical protein